MSSTHAIELGQLSSSEQFIATWNAERGAYNTFCEYLTAVDDQMQYERAGACFTENAEVTYDMKDQPMVFHGRREFIGYLQGVKQVLAASAHVVGQHRFSWHQGRPRIVAYVTAWHWFHENSHLGENRPADFTTVGYAEDEFTQVAGIWLISRRLVKPASGLVAFGDRPPSNIVGPEAG
jgi:hypothetical protein